MPTMLTQPKSVAPAKLEADLQDMDAGVLKDIPAKTSLTIDGSAITGTQIDTKLKGYLTTIQAADAAKQQYLAAVTARRAITAEARAFYLQLKKAVTVLFGAQSPQLDDFGLAPAKAKTAKTSGQNAVSLAKRQATRAARGVKGKKQKAAINPNVVTPSVVVSPDGTVQAAPAPAATPTAAPAGSATPNGAAPAAAAPAPSGNNPASTPQASAGTSAPVVPAGSGS
ncbi:MAG TPA: hypothetical protein VMB50_16725 [Myxococcales bacterium]|nr:hypothetical protein [Myxococcales bacterium]